MALDLSQTISFGSYKVTAETLVFAVAVLAAGWLINRISNILIARGVERRGGSEHATISAQKVSGYLIYSLTGVALLGVFGVPLSALGTAVGLIGLGLSFALKDMIANFISGIMILVYRPFKIGDQITVQGESGTVADIKVRATDVKTYDGRKLIVPNSVLYNNTVVNNTAYDQRRFEVIVGIGYDDDVEEAKELAIEALEDAEGVEDEPGPEVLVDQLGDSSVNLKLRGWTRPSRANMVAASSKVTQLVKQKYDEAGIDIPFPIRTVYMEEAN